jgi:hypothetical protein
MPGGKSCRLNFECVNTDSVLEWRGKIDSVLKLACFGVSAISQNLPINKNSSSIEISKYLAVGYSKLFRKKIKDA